jgi:hypothetical protein
MAKRDPYETRISYIRDTHWNPVGTLATKINKDSTGAEYLTYQISARSKLDQWSKVMGRTVVLGRLESHPARVDLVQLGAQSFVEQGIGNKIKTYIYKQLAEGFFPFDGTQLGTPVYIPNKDRKSEHDPVNVFNKDFYQQVHRSVQLAATDFLNGKVTKAGAQNASLMDIVLKQWQSGHSADPGTLYIGYTGDYAVRISISVEKSDYPGAPRLNMGFMLNEMFINAYNENREAAKEAAQTKTV